MLLGVYSTLEIASEGAPEPTMSGGVIVACPMTTDALIQSRAWESAVTVRSGRGS
jgi:hypothetical protein